MAMSIFSPVTDAELERARVDRAFRQQLLTDNLEVLLARLQKLRKDPPSDANSATQIREGVQMAVKLADLIQSIAGPPSAA
jgi:hypothetical protein